MAEAPARKVIASVTCGAVTLKLTLTDKVLAKSLRDGCIGPFLGAYNKKNPGDMPLTADLLAYVEIDGVVAKDIDATGASILPNKEHKVELFPPGSPPPSSAAAEPAPAPAHEPVKKAPEPAAAPTPPPPTPPTGVPMASNTMPKCKYGLACRIIDPVIECTAKRPKEDQHWFKFQHPCFWVCKAGHPELGPPGMLCPLDPAMYAKNPELAKMIQPCTNFDPDHRRCFRHPEDDVKVVEVVSEEADELDAAVVSGDSWTAPEVGAVSEEEAMEAKMAAAEAAGSGDFAGAIASYSKALVAMPSALMYAKRAEALLKVGQPTAAVSDCEKAVELNPDSAKAYKVLGKALAKRGLFADAYAKLCVGNKIDEDEDSAALSKALKAKCDKMKKIGEQRSKRASAALEALGAGDVWASLEIDVHEKYGEASLEALAKWYAAEPVGLKAKMGELGATEEIMDKVIGALPA